MARFFGLSCTLPPFSVPHQSVHRTQIVSIQGTMEVTETSSYRAVSCEIFAPRHMARASMIEKPPTFIVPISHHSSSDMVRQDISTCFSNCSLASLILRTEPNKEDRKNDGKLKSMLLDWAVDTTDSGSKSVLMRARVGVQSNSRRTCLSTDLAWVACGAPDSCCLPLFSFAFQSSNAV